MSCGSGQYHLNFVEAKLRVWRNVEKHCLTAVKVLLTAKCLRSYVFPFSHKSSVGFCSGALGANKTQVTSCGDINFDTTANKQPYCCPHRVAALGDARSA